MWKIKAGDDEIQDKVMGISVSEDIGSQNNSYTLRCKGIDQLYHFKELTIHQDNVKRFGGIILEQNFQDAGIKVCNINATDYNHNLQNRIVAENFMNMSVSNMLMALLGKYAPEFTFFNMKTCGVVIDKISFDYVTLSEAIKSIMEYVPTWHYYIDQYKDFHFFSGYEKKGLSFVRQANGKYNFLYKSLNVEYSATGVVNRVWIVGNKRPASNEITQYFQGEGKQRYFHLAYEPEEVTVFLDGVEKVVGVDAKDDGSHDFLVSKKNKLLYIPEGIVNAYVGEIKIQYKPLVQVIDYFENTDSENPYLIEKIIKNKNIIDKLAARQYGKAEIKRNSKVKTFLKFSTREDVKIAERCFVQVDEFGINGYFLVTQVNTEITPTDVVRGVVLEEI